MQYYPKTAAPSLCPLTTMFQATRPKRACYISLKKPTQHLPMPVYRDLRNLGRMTIQTLFEPSPSLISVTAVPRQRKHLSERVRAKSEQDKNGGREAFLIQVEFFCALINLYPTRYRTGLPGLYFAPTSPSLPSRPSFLLLRAQLYARRQAGIQTSPGRNRLDS